MLYTNLLTAIGLATTIGASAEQQTAPIFRANSLSITQNIDYYKKVDQSQQEIEEDGPITITHEYTKYSYVEQNHNYSVATYEYTHYIDTPIYDNISSGTYDLTHKQVAYNFYITQLRTFGITDQVEITSYKDYEINGTPNATHDHYYSMARQEAYNWLVYGNNYNLSKYQNIQSYKSIDIDAVINDIDNKAYKKTTITPNINNNAPTGEMGYVLDDNNTNLNTTLNIYIITITKIWYDPSEGHADYNNWIIYGEGGGQYFIDIYMDENTTTYEYIDIGGVMFDVLSMPFAFFSTAFNLTLFPGTQWSVNVSQLLLSIIGVLIFVYLLNLIIKR